MQEIVLKPFRLERNGSHVLKAGAFENGPEIKRVSLDGAITGKLLSKIQGSLVVIVKITTMILNSYRLSLGLALRAVNPLFDMYPAVSLSMLG